MPPFPVMTVSIDKYLTSFEDFLLLKISHVPVASEASECTLTTAESNGNVAWASML